MRIKYSIIVPLYNTENYISECLSSLCAFERTDIEIIVVDDGSTDHSIESVERWREKDSRVTVYHQENSGVAVARNYGIKAANGEWIIFVDADDYVLNGMLQTLDDVITQYPGCDYFCFANDSIEQAKKIVLEENKEQLILATLKAADSENIFKRIPLLAGICGKIIRKSFLEKHVIQFIPGLVMGEDMVFNMEIQMNVNQLVLIPGNYYYYRVNHQSASRGVNNKIPESDLRFQKELATFSDKYKLNVVKNTGCTRSALGGILVSCNSCFYRYPLKEYTKFKQDLKRFISNSVYTNALKETKDYSEFSLFQKFVLVGLKMHIYWPGYVLKHIYWKFSN